MEECHDNGRKLMFLYTFSPTIGGIVKERCGGVLKLSFFQNVDITSVLEKTQPTENIKNRHEIVN